MLHTVRVEWTKDSGGRWKMEEVPGSEKFYEAQLVLLALGFLGPEGGLVKALGLKVDGRSNIQTPPKVRGKIIWIPWLNLNRNTPQILRESLLQAIAAGVNHSLYGE